MTCNMIVMCDNINIFPEHIQILHKKYSVLQFCPLHNKIIKMPKTCYYMNQLSAQYFCVQACAKCKYIYNLCNKYARKRIIQNIKYSIQDFKHIVEILSGIYAS